LKPRPGRGVLDLEVLFFIELGSRRVHVAGCTQHPSDGWVAQQACQLSWSLAGRASPPRFLIHDRDSKFTGAFDEIFRSAGIKIVRTPIQAPQANAFAERFVGTVRRECLNWILIAGRRQLERVLHTYVDHYNGHRPHRGLGLVPPQPRSALRLAARADPLRIRRRDRLGGLIHEYSAAA
jgi:putative transposase